MRLLVSYGFGLCSAALQNPDEFMYEEGYGTARA